MLSTLVDPLDMRAYTTLVARSVELRAYTALVLRRRLDISGRCEILRSRIARNGVASRARDDIALEQHMNRLEGNALRLWYA